ncbi:MAG: hypothetical protein JNL52_15385 [Flavobacteriales bacterium]|nr:hypothetical protein [Flavobacteriales bacterium]
MKAKKASTKKRGRGQRFVAANTKKAPRTTKDPAKAIDYQVVHLNDDDILYGKKAYAQILKREVKDIEKIYKEHLKAFTQLEYRKKLSSNKSGVQSSLTKKGVSVRAARRGYLRFVLTNKTVQV